MKDEEALYELTDRYLAGLMHGEELAAFEKMLEHDLELSQLVEKTRKVHELVSMEGLNQELSVIRNAEKEYLFRQKFLFYGKWLSGIVLLISGVWLTVKVMSPAATSDNRTTISASKKATSLMPTDTTGFFTEPGSVNKESSSIRPYIQQEARITVPVIIDSIMPKVERKMVDSAVVLVKPEPVYVKPCQETVSAIIETGETCAGKSNGTITLKAVSGGIAPYYISLNQGDYRAVNAFDFLQSGSYAVKVMDSKGCASQLYVLEVKEKFCAAPVHDVFSYQQNQEWIFPETGEKDFEFTVYNKARQIVYSTNVINNVQSSWNGYSSAQQKLPMGVYSFYFTKTGNIILQGSITVVE